MSKPGKAFLYLIYFAIVAILVGFIVDSFRVNNPSAVSKAPAPAQHQRQTASQPSQAASGTSTTPSSTPAQTPSPATNSPVLADTGPGSIVSLFVIASITGATLHRRRLSKRFNP
jgi:Na+/H+-dicarboxylate symporter